jgi:hypothetical protein
MYKNQINSLNVKCEFEKIIVNFDSACTKIGDLKLEYLREFEAEFEKALARESGVQGVLFEGKKPKVENQVTLSL